MCNKGTDPSFVKYEKFYQRVHFLEFKKFIDKEVL